MHILIFSHLYLMFFFTCTQTSFTTATIFSTMRLDITKYPLKELKRILVQGFLCHNNALGIHQPYHPSPQWPATVFSSDKPHTLPPPPRTSYSTSPLLPSFSSHSYHLLFDPCPHIVEVTAHGWIWCHHVVAVQDRHHLHVEERGHGVEEGELAGPVPQVVAR